MGQPVPTGGYKAERVVLWQGVERGGWVNLYSVHVVRLTAEMGMSGQVMINTPSCTGGWRNRRKGCVRAGGTGRR